MGLWSILFGGSNRRIPASASASTSTAHSPTVIAGDGTFETEVVGESNYQDALWRAVRSAEVGESGYRYRTNAVLRSEPTNPYDRNTVQILIGDRVMGYLSREDAVQHAPLMARHGHSVSCPALICGGFLQSEGRASLGAWLDLLESETPHREVMARSTGVSEFRARNNPPTHGLFKGKHYTEYVEDIKALKRHDALEEALDLLNELIGAVEDEARAEGNGVAPWYYEQAAIVCRKRRDFQGEIAVLERYVAQSPAPGASPSALLERLEKARAKLTTETAKKS